MNIKNIFSSLFFYFNLSFYVNQTNSCNILALSGGGVFGAFELGVVSTIFERENKLYDIITGVSAGSINTAYLSTIEAGTEKNHIDEFRNLWLSMKDEDIYKKEYFFNGLSLYSSKPLKKTLTNIFQNKQVKRKFMISASSLKKATSTIFTDEDVNIHNQNIIDILMSSTAIPLLFPPYEYNNDIYVDGGLTSNVIFDDAVTYCINKYPLNVINIDVIICGRKVPYQDDIPMKFIPIMQRIITIIQQQVEYGELLENIDYLDDKIQLTFYEQNEESSISLLDFTKTLELYNQGYNFTNVKIYKNF